MLREVEERSKSRKFTQRKSVVTTEQTNALYFIFHKLPPVPAPVRPNGANECFFVEIGQRAAQKGGIQNDFERGCVQKKGKPLNSPHAA